MQTLKCWFYNTKAPKKIATLEKNFNRHKQIHADIMSHKSHYITQKYDIHADITFHVYITQKFSSRNYHPVLITLQKNTIADTVHFIHLHYIRQKYWVRHLHPFPNFWHNNVTRHINTYIIFLQRNTDKSSCRQRWEKPQIVSAVISLW